MVLSMIRLDLFPESTTIENDSLSIAGLSLSALAETHGTPLYVYDRASMDNAVVGYRSALKQYYPAASGITYAGKAFLCLAVAQWTQEQDLWLDCTGEGELAIAVKARVPSDHLLVHGVNKSPADLVAAVQHAGTIVVDNLNELSALIELFSTHHSSFITHPFPRLWLRLQPGLAVDTHAYTQTGQHGSKFGMTADEISQAADLCRRHGLPLTGLHFHLGSQFDDPAPLGPAVELACELAAEGPMVTDWDLCPGGGWGVAYHEDDLPQPDLDSYVRFVSELVTEACSHHALALPRLHLEPGRSLVARAGVAIYRVGAVKRRGDRTWLLTDGGMADNPRRALYGARYSALPVAGLGRELTERVDIAGPYCESGDILLEDLTMPKIEPGELIAVPVSGAYHLSMASNYNGARRPAVVWLDGEARLIQRRESVSDLIDRDLGLQT